MSLRDKVDIAIAALSKQGIEHAEIGIILGTGLGGLIDDIEILKIVEYSDIPGFMNPTAETHSGKLILGKLSGKTIIAMNGRFHYYEGYDMKEITFPIYILKELGVSSLFVSNAAGNLNANWNKGDLMLFKDHINLLPENPLRGRNDEGFGPRWPDMFETYDKALNGSISSAAEHLGITIRKGVYAAVQGPNLETAAEYQMLIGMGADAVGMSTVPEVIVAKYLGIATSAISVLTDDCDAERLSPVNIAEILEIAAGSEKIMTSLIKEVINRLN
jgi:purine-nucleoside phosphorylase